MASQCFDVWSVCKGALYQRHDSCRCSKTKSQQSLVGVWSVEMEVECGGGRVWACGDKV